AAAAGRRPGALSRRVSGGASRPPRGPGGEEGPQTGGEKDKGAGRRRRAGGFGKKGRAEGRAGRGERRRPEGRGTEKDAVGETKVVRRDPGRGGGSGVVPFFGLFCWDEVGHPKGGGGGGPRGGGWGRGAGRRPAAAAGGVWKERAGEWRDRPEHDADADVD